MKCVVIWLKRVVVSLVREAERDVFRVRTLLLSCVLVLGIRWWVRVGEGITAATRR